MLSRLTFEYNDKMFLLNASAKSKENVDLCSYLLIATKVEFVPSFGFCALSSGKHWLTLEQHMSLNMDRLITSVRNTSWRLEGPTKCFSIMLKSYTDSILANNRNTLTTSQCSKYALEQNSHSTLIPLFL